MALPFLNSKKDAGGIAGTILKRREPNEKPKESKPEEYNLEDCAKDILTAINANDAAGLASALKEVFQKLDSEPHKEGPHVSPHSYDAQNIKAAKDNE